jgi:hypothetical protein
VKKDPFEREEVCRLVFAILCLVAVIGAAGIFGVLAILLSSPWHMQSP